MPKHGDTRWLSRDTALMAVDSSYEELGSSFYDMSRDANEKAETEATAQGLCVQMQHVEFVFFLKYYRQLFDLCSPIISMMQKPTLDAVQVTSMISDFDEQMRQLNYDEIWEDTILMAPEIPVVRARVGWRAVEEPKNGTRAAWKQSLTDRLKNATINFQSN